MTDSRTHACVLRAIVDHGRAPTIEEIAGALSLAGDEARASLRRLHASHGLVLDPARDDVWIAHPFSLSPTATWVEAESRGWWAPCLWCACGIVRLCAPTSRVHARWMGEGEPLVISFVDGAPISHPDLLVHFATPPREAWDNVVRWCASVLPFSCAEDVDRWCERHGIARGESIPLRRVADLAAHWYGRHLDEDWRKWTLVEAQAIFDHQGLVGDFWRLPKGEGTY
jgi:hypothetical protein